MLLAAVGCGLMAGVFSAFSTFVMKALARLPAHEGIAAMQSINVVAVNHGSCGIPGTSLSASRCRFVTLAMERSFRCPFTCRRSGLPPGCFW